MVAIEPEQFERMATSASYASRIFAGTSISMKKDGKSVPASDFTVMSSNPSVADFKNASGGAANKYRYYCVGDKGGTVDITVTYLPNNLSVTKRVVIGACTDQYSLSEQDRSVRAETITCWDDQQRSGIGVTVSYNKYTSMSSRIENEATLVFDKPVTFAEAQIMLYPDALVHARFGGLRDLYLEIYGDGSYIYGQHIRTGYGTSDDSRPCYFDPAKITDTGKYTEFKIKMSAETYGNGGSDNNRQKYTLLIKCDYPGMSF